MLSPASNLSSCTTLKIAKKKGKTCRALQKAESPHRPGASASARPRAPPRPSRAAAAAPRAGGPAAPGPAQRPAQCSRPPMCRGRPGVTSAPAPRAQGRSEAGPAAPPTEAPPTGSAPAASVASPRAPTFPEPCGAGGRRMASGHQVPSGPGRGPVLRSELFHRTTKAPWSPAHVERPRAHSPVSEGRPPPSAIRSYSAAGGSERRSFRPPDFGAERPAGTRTGESSQAPGARGPRPPLTLAAERLLAAPGREAPGERRGAGHVTRESDLLFPPPAQAHIRSARPGSLTWTRTCRAPGRGWGGGPGPARARRDRPCGPAERELGVPQSPRQCLPTAQRASEVPPRAAPERRI
uniref:Uncharacterized protein n=1 Tax=Rangifer tarandus platyrhynchus TaxID=3082113 RepID=A0ACB0ELQ9_RANTA|nr:unnamed protein product [Rangifer tarandus platyrhynchus]